MSHIFDAVERDTGIVIHAGQHAGQRAIQHVWHHKPYDSASSNPATPGADMSLTDTIASVENDVATFTGAP